jgi:hypothetical protein
MNQIRRRATITTMSMDIITLQIGASSRLLAAAENQDFQLQDQIALLGLFSASTLSNAGPGGPAGDMRLSLAGSK